MQATKGWAMFGMFALCAGCSKDAPAVDAAASVAPSASAAPTTSVAAIPSASAAPEEHHDCPAGSTGIGNFSHPCEATGKNVRMVALSWNGKSDDKGSPWFNTTSKAAKTLLYGRLAIYFYDKAGKQIDVKEAVEGSDKTHAFHVCAGNVFAGGLNPAEKAKYTFSCMKKADMPAGATAMEAEATIVGFAEPSLKKNEFYWKNADLAPEARPKGGAK